MKITWLGQHGVAIQSGNKLLMADPYLMDTMHIDLGDDFERLVPVDEKWLDVRPDVVLLTHDHIDHLDMPSLQAVVTAQKNVEVLAGVNAWNKVRGQLTGDHNYIMMVPGNEWTSCDIRIRAIEARHSDHTGVGYVVDAEGLTIVISGDSLYFADIAREVEKPVDIAIVVMNGKGNNMNCVDAARYCASIGTKIAIPTHWGLFKKFQNDENTPGKFAAEAEKRGIKAKTLKIYETVDTAELLEG